MGTADKSKARAQWISWRDRNQPLKRPPCDLCGQPFAPHGRQRRCDSCRILTCRVCCVHFLPPARRIQKYCSRSCKDASLRGTEPAHLAAHRGVKPRTYHITHHNKRGSAIERQWRNLIFERDSYTCQKCGQRGGRLEADHIKPFMAYPRFRYLLSNGRTLCHDCHRKTKTYGFGAYWAERKKIAAKRLSQGVLSGVS